MSHWQISIVRDPGYLTIENNIVSLSQWRLHADPVDIDVTGDIEGPTFPLKTSLVITSRLMPQVEALCKIKIGPAKSTHLLAQCDAMPSQIRNGDTLPDLIVTCRDDRQYMGECEDGWEVTLDGDCFSNSIQRIYDGGAVFSNCVLQLDDEEIPSEGLNIEQYVSITGPPYEIDRAKFSIHVLPSQHCCRMEVLLSNFFLVICIIGAL